MDLCPARSIRPSTGDRERILDYLKRRATACKKAGETLVARHFEIAADDIEKGLHW